MSKEPFERAPIPPTPSREKTRAPLAFNSAASIKGKGPREPPRHFVQWTFGSGIAPPVEFGNRRTLIGFALKCRCSLLAVCHYGKSTQPFYHDLIGSSLRPQFCLPFFCHPQQSNAKAHPEVHLLLLGREGSNQ